MEYHLRISFASLLACEFMCNVIDSVKKIMEQREYSFSICENLAKNRLDKILVEQTDLSRSKIKTLIEEGQLAIDGQQVKNVSHKTKLGEEVTLIVPETVPSTLEAQEIPLDIFYEDNDLLVINKQAGLTVHPGAGNYNNTLVNALLFHCKESLSGIGGVERPGIVHRLDKDTSGLMVVAKNDTAHLNLSEQIANRDFKRIYQALVWGVPNPLSGTISANINRHRIHRTRMSVVNHGGKTAVTHYETMKIFQNGSLSLVECRLKTGRTHQIRVHMSHAGHSLIGDQTYGNNKKKSSKYLVDEAYEAVDSFPRQALHSYHIEFTHPTTKEIMEFKIDLPQDMQDLISKI